MSFETMSALVTSMNQLASSFDAMWRVQPNAEQGDAQTLWQMAQGNTGLVGAVGSAWDALKAAIDKARAGDMSGDVPAAYQAFERTMESLWRWMPAGAGETFYQLARRAGGETMVELGTAANALKNAALQVRGEAQAPFDVDLGEYGNTAEGRMLLGLFQQGRIPMDTVLARASAWQIERMRNALAVDNRIEARRAAKAAEDLRKYELQTARQTSRAQLASSPAVFFYTARGLPVPRELLGEFGAAGAGGSDAMRPLSASPPLYNTLAGNAPLGRVGVPSIPGGPAFPSAGMWSRMTPGERSETMRLWKTYGVPEETFMQILERSSPPGGAFGQLAYARSGG